MTLKVGDMAPDFELPAVTGTERHNFKLSDLRGKKNVVLAFYAADWTPTCSAQIPGYNNDYDKFAALDAQVVGISCDSTFCHIGWQKEVGALRYPLCSDFFPHGAVTEKYGVLRTGPPLPGIGERAVFVIDKQGKIAFVKVYDLGEHPPNEEALAVLRKLQGLALPAQALPAKNPKV